MGKPLRIIGIGILYGVAGAAAGLVCGGVFGAIAFLGHPDMSDGIRVGAFFGSVLWGLTAGGVGMLLTEASP